jgi:S-adenosylhomocysteine hydrolase
MVVNLSHSEETESILGSQEQVVTAVNHIERVLKEKAVLFNKVNINNILFKNKPSKEYCPVFEFK